MVKIIDGKEVANQTCAKIAESIKKIKKYYDKAPTLAVVLVGGDPASKVYVSNKNKKAESLGINSIIIELDENIPEQDLLKKIAELNNDNNVNGILVQLPLPKHINKAKIINAISVAKDVDGFHIENVGKLYTKQDCFVPCTPQGCLILIKSILGQNLSGKRAVIFGRSDIVGNPMAELLLQANCTTTILHSKSENVKEISQTADIVVVAVGKAEMIDASYIKEGALIIDVGINRKKNGYLVGDVNFNDVLKKASAVTPVPGGVGPMTIACLMLNSFYAFLAQNNIDKNNYLN